MKRIILLFVFIGTYFGAFASNASLFSVDENTLQEDFQELTTLETQLEKGVDFSDTSFILQMNENSTASFMSTTVLADDRSGEACLWGFICCPIGLFTVALNDDYTSDEKRGYWVGVCANVLISGVITGVVLIVDAY